MIHNMIIVKILVYHAKHTSTALRAQDSRTHFKIKFLGPLMDCKLLQWC